MTYHDTSLRVADWREDPRAKVILASLAKHPIRPTVCFDAYVLIRDEYTRYQGFRVDCLDKIHAEHFARVRTPATRDGDWSAFDAFMDQGDAQDAIYAAQNPERPEPALWDTMMADVAMSLRPMGSMAA
jgi:hypothetical protein